MASTRRAARATASSRSCASSRILSQASAVDLRRKLGRAMARAVTDFEMIAEGDRILCAVSGGKDSYSMHELLVDLARRAPVNFSLIAVNIDQGHPGYPGHLLRDYMASRG